MGDEVALTKPQNGKRGEATASLGSAKIQVEPAQGYFVNFDVDTTYAIPFTVRNLSHEMLRLRFTQPSNQRVFCINTDSVNLAPGLSHVIEAEFITHVPQDYEDSFVVLLITNLSLSRLLPSVALISNSRSH
ncbi:hypothetical protein TRVL_02734 [Trypanosoma vivax]|nr:hypothetical protein TRVL_02734 [Trypanosoma vivax]